VSDPAALRRLLSTGEEPFDEYAERILDAARDQLVQFGLRRTSLDEIARAAGVGRATLFRRFPNRDALMSALASREARRCIASVDAQVSEIDDPREFLIAGALAVIGEITGNTLLQRLLQTDPEEMLPLLAGRGAPILAMGRAYIAAQLERLIEQGGVISTDSQAIAEALARLVLSLALNPETVLPLADEDALEALVGRTLAPLLLVERY
jgi:AcrR family transcriptional regulator